MYHVPEPRVNDMRGPTGQARGPPAGSRRGGARTTTGTRSQPPAGATDDHQSTGLDQGADYRRDTRTGSSPRCSATRPAAFTGFGAASSAPGAWSGDNDLGGEQVQLVQGAVRV